MKMTKITAGFSILVMAGLMVISCNKKAAVEPEADKEFQSSIDASYATNLVTEIDDIAGYLGEGYTASNSSFFTNAGSSGSIVYSTPSSSVVAITYVGTVTCIDGKKRSGTVSLNFSMTNTVVNADTYRRPGYKAVVSLSNYVVDGYHIYCNNNFTITNTTPYANFSASVTPLTWKLDGDFSIYNATATLSATDSMTWKGYLTKTLTNSTNSFVLSPNMLTPIRWSINTSTNSPGAVCKYDGKFSGVVSKTKSYNYEVKESTPENNYSLYRDFSCSPDKYVLVPVSSSFTTAVSEWHPIIKGISNFTVNGLPDPRLIDYNSGTIGSSNCDNNVSVTIKGITYPIDLKK